MQRRVAIEQIVTIITGELFTYYVAAEIIISVLAIYFFSIHPVDNLFRGILLVGFLLYLFFGMIIVFALRKKTMIVLHDKLRSVRWLDKYSSYLQQAIANNISIEPSLNLIIKKRQELLPVIFCHISVFFMDALSVFALLLGLGITLSYYEVFIVLICTKIISLLPVSPGGLIVYEGSLAFFLNSVGVQLGTAVIVTLLFRLLSFWLPMIAGFFLLKGITSERYSRS